MEPRFIIAQIVGFVAMAIGIVSFQFNSRKKILVIQVVMAMVWVLHFLILGVKTGMVLNIFGGLRFFVYSFKNEKWKKAWFVPVIFSLIFIACGILTYESWISLLPMTAMVIASFAMWMDNTKYLRYLNLPSSFLWLVYDFCSRSVAGSCNEAFCIISIIVAMFRFDRKKTDQ